MNSFSARLLAVVVALAGALMLTTLPYKLVPDRVLPTVGVRFTWPNVDERSVESLVTSRIEGNLAGLSGLNKIFSRSFPGRGEIFLEFDGTTSINEKKMEVATLIKQIIPGLPAGVGYPLVAGERPVANDVRLLTCTLTSPDETEVQELITNSLVPALRKIDGVKSLSLEGLPSRQLDIEYFPRRLQQSGLTERNLAAALQRSMKSALLGEVYTIVGTQEQHFQMTLASVQSTDELLDLPVGIVNGRLVRLKDVASIHVVRQDAISSFRINGERTVSLSVLADEHVNQIALADQLKKTIQQCAVRFPLVNVRLVRDASGELKQELSSLGWQCLISLGLLSLMTALFYRNIRFLLVLFASIMMSLLLTVILLKVTSIPIHLYTLMALTLSVGFIIDNAIVAVDHYRKSESKVILLPITAATLTNVAPLIVIFYLDDSSQLNLIDFAWSLTLALTASLLVTFFFIPAITSKVNTKQSSVSLSGIQRTIRWMTRYRSLLFALRRHRALLTASLILAFGFPFGMLTDKTDNGTSASWTARLYDSTIGSELYQGSIKPLAEKYLGGAINRFAMASAGGDFVQVPERPRITLRINAPFGSTTVDVDQICNGFEKKLSLNKAAGIDFFQTRLFDERHAQLDVFCVPQAGTQALTEIKGFLEKEALTIGGIEIAVTGAGLPYSTSDVEVLDSHLLFFGYDYEELSKQAGIVKAYLEENPRVAQVEVRSEPSWFASDEQKRYATADGIHGHAFLSHLYQHYSPIPLGTLRVAHEPYDRSQLPVRLVPDNESPKLYELMSRQQMIDDTTRYKPQFDIRLGSARQSQSIVKDNQQYQLVIQYSFNGTASQSKRFCSQTAANFQEQLPAGFSLHADAFEAPGTDHGQLYLSLLIAVGVIFSVCAILFESIRRAFLLIAIVPITFTGVLYGLYYLELGFTQGTYAALILLAGLLVNTSIFIVSEFSAQRRRLLPSRAYCKAIHRKFVPMLVTSLATLAGLIPFLTYESDNSFWYPFAATTTLGMGLALLVILLVLPIYLIEKRP